MELVKKNVKLADSVFGQPFNEALIHQVVTAQMAGGRAGTKAQKSRSDVRSGGTTFAARPRDFRQKVNRKMYRAAIRSILSELLRLERITVVENIQLANPKTKELVESLATLNLGHVLIILDQADTNVILAARNLPNVEVIDVDNIDP